MTEAGENRLRQKALSPLTHGVTARWRGEKCVDTQAQRRKGQLWKAEEH